MTEYILDRTKIQNVGGTLINPATEETLSTIATNTATAVADYTLRYDEGATYTYIGHAVPATATSAASWRIKRLTNSDNTTIYADGNANFDNVWDNRASLSYS